MDGNADLFCYTPTGTRFHVLEARTNKHGQTRRRSVCGVLDEERTRLFNAVEQDDTTLIYFKECVICFPPSADDDLPF